MTAADVEAVRAVVHTMYTALGDRAEFDRHLDPSITIWESDAAGMLHGTRELDELRDERAGRPRPHAAPRVRPEELLVDCWGDTALARYVLTARYDGAAEDETFRVTDVLRRSGAVWKIVHHHAERTA